MNGNIEEELYRERLRQEQERARQQRLAGAGKQLARQQLKRAGSKLAKKAGKRAAVQALLWAGSALLAALPWILTALAAVALVLFVVFLAVTSIAAACNADGLNGRLAQAASGIASYVVQYDICDELSEFGSVASFFDQGALPPIPEFEVCPNLGPLPPGIEKVECVDCVDITAVAPTVPIKNNSLAKSEAVTVVQRLVSSPKVTGKFRVTEAFCPTTRHASHDHYNGYAVDVDILSELKLDANTPRNPQDVIDLFEAVKALGPLHSLKCEYPPSVSPKCSAARTTTGGHIHFVPAHPH